MKVTIGIPNQEWIHRILMRVVVYMFENSCGHDLCLDDLSDKPIDNCRNKIIKNFLERGDDYLLFIDSDNPPMRNPLELVNLKKDIIVLPTPIWFTEVADRKIGHDPIIWNCFDFDEGRDGWVEHPPKTDTMEQIDSAGTGCVLLSRRVLETVRPAFYRKWNAEGIVEVGSDLLFFKRAREAGFEVYAHYGYCCHHMKMRDIAQIYQTTKARDIRQANKKNLNNPEYWDTRWRDHVLNGTERQDWNMIVSLVADHVEKDSFSVLDFGCGSGELTRLIAGLPGADVKGMDYSERAVGLARKLGCKAVQGEMPDGQYDVIVCSDVLQTSDDPVRFLGSLADASPLVIVSVPNNCYPRSVEPANQYVYNFADLQSMIPGKIIDKRPVNDRLIVVFRKE